MTSHNQLPFFRHLRSSQDGFTLVEIMVGLVIGMLATLVVMQVFSVFETQKRTTTGTADAQTNGSIALYNIERDLQMAGYPLMPLPDSSLECTTLAISGVAITTNHLTPVTIGEGVAAPNVSASDSITIRYGDSPMGGIPTRITGALVGNDVPVDNNFGCRAGDITLIINGTACAISKATSTPPATVTLADTTAVVSGADLACLGTTWHEVTYQVSGGNLLRQDLAISNDLVPNVAGIVNLQAQYGISAAGLSNTDPEFNTVKQWVDAGGIWAAPAPIDRNRIKAIKIAVVARNAKMETTDVTSTCNTATLSGLCTWAGDASSPAPTVDLGNSDPKWLRYHYRVFETIIPLRNVIWAKSTL